MRKATIRPYRGERRLYTLTKRSASTSIKAARSACHYIEMACYREYSVTRMQKHRRSNRPIFNFFHFDR